MEKDLKNNMIIDDKPGQAFSMVSPYGVMPHDVLCKPRKRIEYILHVKAIKIKQNLPETKQMICFTYNELIYAIFKTQS